MKETSFECFVKGTQYTKVIVRSNYDKTKHREGHK